MSEQDSSIFNLLSKTDSYEYGQAIETVQQKEIDQGHPLTTKVKFSDLILYETYIFSGAYVSNEHHFYIDKYIGYNQETDEYLFQRHNNVAGKHKDAYAFPFILGADFRPERKRPGKGKCRTGYSKDEISLIYNKLRKDKRIYEFIKLVKEGLFTSKTSTYLNMSAVDNFLSIDNQTLRWVYDVFYKTQDILKDNKILADTNFCVYRTARLTIGGPYGLNPDRLFIPLPFSCTTSFKFAFKWGSNDNYILVINTEAPWFPADDPYADKTQNEIVLPAGKLEIKDRYYNDELKRFFLICDFQYMEEHMCKDYIQDFSLHNVDTYNSNIGLKFNTSDIFINHVIENSE